MNAELSQFCRIIQGGRLGHSGKQFVEDGFPAYGAGGLNGYLPDAEFDVPGIVLSAIGARCGKCFLPEAREWASLANTQLIFPDPDKANIRFIWYQLNDERSWTRRGAAQPFIRPADVKTRQVYFPSLDEQNRLTALLDKADAIRRKREQALALADDFLKSVFLKMFGRPTRPNQRLETQPLGQICDLFAGNSLPTGEAYLGQEDGLLLLKVGDLNLPGNDQVVMTAREWVPARGRTGAAIVAPKEAIVFPKRGGAIATNKKRVLGRSCILDPNLMAVAPKNGAPISYPYLRVWFDLLDLSSISNGSTVPQLNKGDLYPLEMPIPKSHDLLKFDGLFHGIARLHRNLVSDLNSAETSFSALSQRAFLGEL